MSAIKRIWITLNQKSFEENQSILQMFVKLVFCIYLSSLLFQAEGGGEVDSNNNMHLYGDFLYEEGEWETMIVDLISREVPTLPLQDFVDEPELEQKVDRVNKLTVYKRPLPPGAALGETLSEEEEEARIVYKRKSVDSKAPVVVLKSNEDHLKVFERKRTFVVLRQNPLTNKTYFASYVYLRFWTDKQKGCTESYLNEKICLEWDTWDNDRGEVKTSLKYFGWTDCASSFLFSCPPPVPTATNVTNNSLELVERGYRNTSMDNEDPSLQKLVFKPAASVPFDDTIDVFFDLEATPAEGRYIRETIRHSSVFNKPEDFLGKTGAAGVSGRSLGDQESPQDSSKLLEESKVKAKTVSENKNKRKEVMHSKLNSRTEWFNRKNELNNLIRTRAKEMGFEEFYKIKKDEAKMESLKQYKDTGELFKELESLGESYVEISEKKLKNLTANEAEEKITIFAAADATQVHMSPHAPASGSGSGGGGGGGEGGEISPSAVFGQALSGIIAQSGGGVSGRSLGASDTKVAENIAKSVLFSSTDTFKSPGWKLKGIELEVSGWEDTMVHQESTIFYGFGSCPFQNETEKSQPPPKEGDFKSVSVEAYQTAVIEFYLNLLRTYCLHEAMEYLQYLVQEGYLNITEGKLVLNPNLELTHKRKLRFDEFRKLSASLEISSFSANYVDELQHDWKKGELNVSRSVHFIQEMGLAFLKQARKVADQHFIKLARSFVLTLKGILTRLLQDHEILLARCPTGNANETVTPTPTPTTNSTNLNSTTDGKPCEDELEMNFKDRFGIHSFMEFLMRGLSPLEMSRGLDVDDVFHQFEKDNYEALKIGLTFFN